MRSHVEQVWGWDDARQQTLFADRFEPEAWEIIQVGGEDAGVLILEEDGDAIYVAEIQVAPEWQGRGVGTAVMRSVIARGRPVTLRVLHVNEGARRLYERLGFRPYKEIETHVYLRIAPKSA